MGSCFSSNADLRHPTANIVSPNGELHRFETPVTVSEVLLHLSQVSSSSSHIKTFFLSNSDRLSYNENIPAMSSDEDLINNQIYFVFPNSSLSRRLSASDMAALAVKASMALNNSSKSSISLSLSKSAQERRRVKNKITPYVEPELISRKVDCYYNYATVKSGGFGDKAAGGLARSGSLKKLQRYSSKRAKLAVRSFRLKLSTIHEGSVA